MLCTGGTDITKFMIVLGIPRGISFEKALYRQQKVVNDRIIGRCKRIVKDALLTEIAVIFRETMADKMNEELVKK